MSSFSRLAKGSGLTGKVLTFTVVAGVILGALAGLLGTVTHSGGIDGGATGITVALLAVLIGSAAFTLLGGVLGWAGFGIGVLAALTLSTAYSEGDMIGAMSEGLSQWWFYGSPAAVLLGLPLAWIGFMFTGAGKPGTSVNSVFDQEEEPPQR
ncbi:MAG: hypothetical protein ACTHUY_01425 [Flaviflexus sp.]|uniref:hypothetical protein n=1 Tax=Flaviflexus sp. TaxID=1969482 RepID=UPI003F93EE78